MTAIAYNSRKGEIVITDLDLEAALPKMSKLAYRWDSAVRTLRITAPASATVQSFRRSIILLPICWKNNEQATSAMIFRSKQLAIYEVRQRSHVGYTIAVQNEEPT